MTQASDIALELQQLSPAKRGLLAKLLLDRLEGDFRLAPGIRADDPPLSFSQARLYFLELFETTQPVYNIPLTAQLKGPLQLPAFKQAFAAIVASQECLRTSFRERNGIPYQLVHAAIDWEMPVYDLEGLPIDERQQRRQQLKQEFITRPFHPGEPPLFRVGIIAVGKESFDLLLVMHHLISDGWSTALLVEDLAEAYRQILAEGSALIAAPAVAYADFATWQNRWFQSSALKLQMEYWRTKLSPAPPELMIPSDFPRPKTMSYRGGRERFTIDEPTTAALRELAAAHGATLFMVLLAAFKWCLYRYSHQTDLAVGTVISNRNRHEIERTMGFFVNTLVLRTSLEPRETFSQFLLRVRQTCLEAYVHQDLPFEKLVQELAPVRDTSKPVLFQVMISLENTPFRTLAAGDIQMTLDDTWNGTCKFDLDLDLWQADSGLHAVMEYNSDLFRAETIQRFNAHYTHVLAELVAGASQPRAMTSASLIEGPRRSLEQAVTMDRLFWEQASLHPEAEAVIDVMGTTSYGDLLRMASTLAQRLGPEVRGRRVAVQMEKSASQYAAVLGIWLARASVLLFNPETPAQKRDDMLKRAEVGWFITEQAETDTTAIQHDIQVLSMDAPSSLPFSPVHGSVEEEAYLVFTSGTTGRPKGTSITHRALYNAFIGWFEVYGLERPTRWLQVAQAGFDVHFGDLVRGLCSGGALAVCRRIQMLDPAELYRLLREHAIDMVELTPSVANLLSEYLHAHGGDLSFMSLFTVGADVWTMRGFRDFCRLVGPETRVINSYGLSETTIDTTWFEPRDACDLDDTACVPIGIPFPNQTIFLLDDDEQLVLDGAIGEIVIAGEAVGRALDSDGRASRFKPVPAHLGGMGSMYLTGDLGRRLSTGDIQFHGRKDQQIKVRGIRIEPAEIEKALQDFPEVRLAIVEIHPESETLEAFVVPADLDEAVLQRLSRERVSQWQEVFDAEDFSARAADPRTHFLGWDNSYTGQPISFEEMSAWQDHIIALARRGNPRRILEIGCGNGLLLLSLAPYTEHYVGSDLSQRTLDYLGQMIATRFPECAHAKLVAGEAKEVLFGPQCFDLTLINSVIQYFPTEGYLNEVLEKAVLQTAPGGRVVVGDVRDLRLADAFYRAIKLHPMKNDTRFGVLRSAATLAAFSEEELLVDPAWFLEFSRRNPRVGALSLHLKTGAAHNELTCFRYEVVLFIQPQHSEAARELPWLSIGNLDALARFAQELDEPVRITGLPNARLGRDRRLDRLWNQLDMDMSIESIRALIDRPDPEEVDPHQAYLRASASGAQVSLLLAGSQDPWSFDLLIQPLSGSSRRV